LTTGAFSTEQVARLVGVSPRRIVAWDTAGVFTPSMLRHPAQPFGRIYTLEDAVALRTLATVHGRVLREGLQELGDWFKENSGLPWSRLRFYIAQSGAISFEGPLTGDVECIEIEPIATEVERVLHQLQTERDACDVGIIRRNRHVMRNEWVVAGTRIPVWMIQELTTTGMSAFEIVREFPILTDADIQAALAFDIADVAPLAS
jgi:uncharacterized protein (DUF433 family)